MTSNRILVPLSETVTVRQTVGYAIRSCLDTAAKDPAREDAAEAKSRVPECHLVVANPYDDEIPNGTKSMKEAKALLERAKRWVREDAGTVDIQIETAVIGTDEYLFGPREYAEQFANYAREHELDHLVLDPEYRPGVTAPMLQPLERELRALGLEFVEAPVERPVRHERLVGTESLDRFVALFVVSYGFYLVLGDPTYWFDLVTGLVVAGIVSITLSHVTFTVAPDRFKSPLRTVRFGLYIPYLVVEIIRANLAISVVILRPSMPIDPTVTRIRTRVRSGLPLLALANSITLTPGTLTVRANDQRLVVHTLIPSAQKDLFGGSLERAVRFVFHGRKSARIPTPEERGDVEVLEADQV